MSYEIFNLIVTVPLSIFVYMSLCFLFSKLIKRTDFVDIAWGFGFVLVAILTLINSKNKNNISIITTLLVLIWGVRLSTYLFLRFRKTKEDTRYVEIKKNWKENKTSYS